jgi:hypothetical protein
MEIDSIVQEVREVRDAFAKQFNYDLWAMHRELKEEERASGRRVVSFPPRRPKLSRQEVSGKQ